MQTETEQFKYRGDIVSVLDSAGGLRQVAVCEGQPFWVKAEKLKPVKKRRTHLHDIPDISADPFVSWLLSQRVYLSGDCPPQFLPRFLDAYQQATGEAFDPATPSMNVSDQDKSWSYTLCVSFPQPPTGMVISYPTFKKSRSTRLTIASNDFVFGLLALGMRFGPNELLRAA